MAKVLDELPPVKSGKGATSKYPWNTWLDGRVWQLKHNEDFECKMPSFRTLASKSARDRGLKLRIRISKDTIIIQAYQP